MNFAEGDCCLVRGGEEFSGDGFHATFSISATAEGDMDNIITNI